MIGSLEDMAARAEAESPPTVDVAETIQLFGSGRPSMA